MSKCDKCGADAYMPFRCRHCGGTYCSEHRVSHDCIKMIKNPGREKSNTPAAIDESGARAVIGRLFSAFRNHLVSSAVSDLRGNMASALLFPVMALIFPVMMIFASSLDISVSYAWAYAMLVVSSVATCSLLKMYRRMEPASTIVTRLETGQSETVVSMLHATWIRRVSVEIALYTTWLVHGILTINWILIGLIALIFLDEAFHVRSCKRAERFLAWAYSDPGTW